MHGIVADVTVLTVDDDALQVQLSARELRSFSIVNAALTSRPLCATTCAERKDGSPKKVIIGFEPARRALSSRSCGLCSVQVVVEGLVMVLGDKIEESLVSVVV